MSAALLPCYRCGKVPTVDPNGGYPVVSCDACYSGPPDFCASGMNTAQAVADWNERMEMEEPFSPCTHPSWRALPGFFVEGRECNSCGFRERTGPGPGLRGSR